jgi:DNA repair exonuclease SbcCD ATPase subunit
MNQLVKEDAKTVRGKQTSSQTALTKNQHLLEQSVQQLSNLQEDLTQEKENRIVQLNDILVRAAEKQSEVKSSYSEIKIKLDSAKTDLKTVRESKSACTFNIAEIDKKLSIYAKNKCPHCLSDLTDTVHIGIKQQLEENKSRFQEELTPIATKISEIEFGARDLEASQEKFRNDHAKLSSAIDSAKRELDSLTQSQDSEKQTQYLQKIIDQLNEDIESTKSELGELEKELSVNQELEVILSDNGMKRILMNQIIPLLNKNILRTSKLLEFKFAFEFDLEFNPIITHLGMQISPESLSAGEQKKMNLIVLLCILELIKMKNNKINLLFLDEIFSSLDSVSIYKVVDLLKTFAKKHNMTVFVISHDPLPEEFFDIKLFVENKDHFSDIRVN